MRGPAADNFPAELSRGSAGLRLELSEVQPKSLRCALGRGEGTPQPPFPQSTSPGHLPSPYPAGERSAPGPAPLPPRALSSASGSHRSAWPQTRALLGRRQYRSGSPFQAPHGPECRGRRESRAPGEGGRSLGTGRVRAPREARGVPPPSPRGCPPALPRAFAPSPRRLLRSRSPPGPGALRFSPVAAPGVSDKNEGRAGSGLAAGERLARERSFALPPAISAK